MTIEDDILPAPNRSISNSNDNNNNNNDLLIVTSSSVSDGTAATSPSFGRRRVEIKRQTSFARNAVKEALQGIGMGTKVDLYDLPDKEFNFDFAAIAYRGKSFFIFDVDNPIRKLAISLHMSIYVERFYLLLTFVNFMLLAFSTPRGDYDYGSFNYFLRYIWTPIYLCFILSEILLKCMAIQVIFGQYAALRSGFTVLDIIILFITSLSYIIPKHINVNLTVLRMYTFLPIMETQRVFSSLRTIIVVIFRSLQKLLYVCLILLLFIVTYAIIGVQAFGGKMSFVCFIDGKEELGPVSYSPCSAYLPCGEGQVCARTTHPVYPNFDWIGDAMLVIFQCMIFEGWFDTMTQLQDHTNGATILYFFSAVIIGGFIIVNVAIAVITHTFSVVHKADVEFAKYLASKKNAESLADGKITTTTAATAAATASTTASAAPIATTSTQLTEEEEEAHAYLRAWRNPDEFLTLSFKDRLKKIFNHKRFSLAISFLVGISVFLLVFQTSKPSPNVLVFIDFFNFFAIVILFLETIGNLYIFGVEDCFKTLGKKRNVTILNVFLLFLAFLEIGLSFTVGSLRSLRLFRIMKFNESSSLFKQYIDTLSHSWPYIASWFCVWFLYMFSYSILGMQLLGHYEEYGRNEVVCCVPQNERSRFDTFYWGFMTVFQLGATFENWDMAYEKGLATTGTWFSSLFFVSIDLICGYFLFGLFLGIILEGFEKVRSEIWDKKRKQRTRQKNRRYLRHETKSKPVHLRDFFTPDDENTDLSWNKKYRNAQKKLLRDIEANENKRATQLTKLTRNAGGLNGSQRGSSRDSNLNSNASAAGVGTGSHNENNINNNNNNNNNSNNSNNINNNQPYPHHNLTGSPRSIRASHLNSNYNIRDEDIINANDGSTTVMLVSNPSFQGGIKHGSNNDVVGATGAVVTSDFSLTPSSAGTTTEKKLVFADDQNTSYSSLGIPETPSNNNTNINNNNDSNNDTSNNSNDDVDDGDNTPTTENDGSPSKQQDQKQQDQKQQDQKQDDEFSKTRHQDFTPIEIDLKAKQGLKVNVLRIDTVKTNLIAFCVPPDHPFRLVALKLNLTEGFHNFMTAVAVCSVITLAMDSPNDSRDFQIGLGATEWLYVFIFAFEAAVKIFATDLWSHPNAYFRSKWNIIDFFNLTMTIISCIVFDANLRIVWWLRLFRSIRPIRLIRLYPGMKAAIQSLLASSPQFANAAGLTFLIFYIYGIIGIEFFGGKFHFCNDRNVKSKFECVGEFFNPLIGANDTRVWNDPDYSYDNIGMALLANFVLVTQNGWLDIMYAGIDATGIDMQPIPYNNSMAALFFISFIFIASIFAMNLFVGVVVDVFSRIEEDRSGVGFLTKEQLEWLDVQRMTFRTRAIPITVASPPEQAIRRWAISMVYHSNYETFLNIFLLFQTVVIMCIRIPDIHKTFDTINGVLWIFDAIFIIDTVLKLIALQPAPYFSNYWHIFDFSDTIIVFISHCIPMQPFRSICIIFRAVRLIRYLRNEPNDAKSKFKRRHHDSNIGWEFVGRTIIQALPSFANVGSILLLSYYIYSIIGVQVFGNVPFGYVGVYDHRGNFRYFYNALVLLFRMTTGEYWVGIMYDVYSPNCVDQPHHTCSSMRVAVPYFVSFMMIQTFILIELFLAIILEAYEAVMANNNHVITEDDLDHFANIWSKRDNLASGYIPINELGFLLRDLGPPLGLMRIANDAHERKFLADIDVPTHTFVVIPQQQQPQQLTKRKSALKLESIQVDASSSDLSAAATAAALDVVSSSSASGVSGGVDEGATISAPLKQKSQSELPTRMKLNAGGVNKIGFSDLLYALTLRHYVHVSINDPQIHARLMKKRRFAAAENSKEIYTTKHHAAAKMFQSAFRRYKIKKREIFHVSSHHSKNVSGNSNNNSNNISNISTKNSNSNNTISSISSSNSGSSNNISSISNNNINDISNNVNNNNNNANANDQISMSSRNNNTSNNNINLESNRASRSTRIPASGASQDFKKLFK